MKCERFQKVIEDFSELVGQTPLIKFRNLPKLAGVPDLELFGKAEFMNPSGSLKDRVLVKILNDAIKTGKLRKGMTIIESTTGNTGISTAMFGTYFGFPVLIVIPAGMSEERMKAIRSFGAKLLTFPGAESDVDLAVKKAQELIKLDPDNYFWVNQFNNEANVMAHYETTGPEIWEQTGGKIDAFVATFGTGGTLTGVGKYLKERNKKIKIYAVEPEECPVLTKQKWGTHRIEGIGDGFIPSIMDLSIIDGATTVSSERAIWMTKRLARDEGLFVGISSGANVQACINIHRKHPKLKRVVTMLNDHGFRYFSTLLFGEMKEVEVPKRAHPIKLTAEQRKRLAKIEKIVV